MSDPDSIPFTIEDLIARAKELVEFLEKGNYSYADLRITQLTVGFQVFKVNEIAKEMKGKQ